MVMAKVMRRGTGTTTLQSVDEATLAVVTALTIAILATRTLLILGNRVVDTLFDDATVWSDYSPSGFICDNF